LCPTQHAGHAEELAYQAACNGFSLVIAAGGDGTVHEVANGLLKSNHSDVTLSIWPCGSANDYAYALGITGDPQQPTETIEADVGHISAPGGRERFFVNGAGVGFNGAVTWEARRLRWLRGVPLYATALFRALIHHFDHPTMTAEFDGVSRCGPTLALSLGLGQREGNFPLLPHADLCDGWFDYLHAGPVSRWELIRHFPNLLRGTLPKNHPRLWLGRCRQFTLHSERPLRIHVDGEFFCQPEDEVLSVSVTLLPRRLRVVRGTMSSPPNR
jgi:diacylglycerol kinase family enzyme